MDPINSLRKKILISGKELRILVSGNSMEPVIHDADSITIKYCDKYAVGDIIVYEYKDTILVHRILKKRHNLYFCKGDNCFRIEEVEDRSILGKVVAINNQEVARHSQILLKMSLYVGWRFRVTQSISRTCQSHIYRCYKYCILRKYLER